MLRGRKFFFILVLAAIGLMLLLSLTIPFTFREEVVVPLGLSRTTELFTDKTLLAKWVVPGISSGNDSIYVVKAYPDKIALAYHVDGDDRVYDYLLERRREPQRNCVVSLVKVTSLWKKYIDSDPVDRLAHASLRNLHEFSNDSKKVYGFKINIGQATDSSYLFMTRQVPLALQYVQPVLLFDSVIEFANHRFMRYNGNRYMNTHPLQHGMIQVTVGIGMDGYPPINADDPVTFKKNAPGQQQVQLEFNDVFANVQEAYKAMDQYKRDHGIIVTDIPLEMLISPGYGFKAIDTVSLKLITPYLTNNP